mgnify:CR=1 FL=1
MYTYDARDPFEFFSCTMTVESEGDIETRLLHGPRIFLEEQILSVVKGMYTKGIHGRVTVTRPIQWFSQVEQTWVRREARIDFEVGV